MAQIYIAFVDTPGFFAGMIRQVIKQKYIHVVLSMDAELEEAYSVGRRNPAVPLFACTKGGKPSGTASGYAGKISLSLCSCRITIYFVEHSILPGKPLHLFFLRGTGIRGVRRLSLGKTFFPCDTKGFHGKIWTETDF